MAAKQPHPGAKPYSNEAHGGSGRAQENDGKTSGEGRHKPTRNAAKGQDNNAKAGYETDAHSMKAHGKKSEAVGAPNESAPMDYDRKTNAEGATSQPVAGHEGLGGKSVGMAEHHMGTDHGGAPHRFPNASGSGGHSFGHPADLRRGNLRMSGHSGAHRIGAKTK